MADTSAWVRSGRVGQILYKDGRSHIAKAGMTPLAVIEYLDVLANG